MIFYLLSILILSSCGSTVYNKSPFTTRREVKSGPTSKSTGKNDIVLREHELSNSVLPISVKKFLELSDNKGVEYEIISFEAATDLKNLGRVSLGGGDSAKALKILSLGLLLFPYRDDLKTYRDIALKRYLNITNDLLSNSNTSCIEKNKRKAFLIKFSPDSISELNASNVECTELTFNKKPKKLLIKEFEKNFLDESPQINVHLESKYSYNLDKDIDYAIWRDKFYPQKDLAIFLTNYFGNIHFLTHSPSVEINKDRATITASFDLNVPEKPENYNYCNELRKVIGVDKGQKIWCRVGRPGRLLRSEGISINSKVSEKLKQITALPIIFKLTMFYQDGSSKEQNYFGRMGKIKELGNYEGFIKHGERPHFIIGYDKYVPLQKGGYFHYFRFGSQELEKTKSLRASSSFMISRKGMRLSLPKKHIQGLKNFTFEIDRNKTFEFLNSTILAKQN